MLSGFYQFLVELFSQRARVGEVSSGLPIVAIGEFSLGLLVLSLLQQAQKIESGYNDLLKSGLPSYEETKKLIDTLFICYNNEYIQQNLDWKTLSEVVVSI